MAKRLSIWGMWGMQLKIRIYLLAVKYWFQGDPWGFAVEYATSIVKGFKRR